MSRDDVAAFQKQFERATSSTATAGRPSLSRLRDHSDRIHPCLFNQVAWVDLNLLPSGYVRRPFGVEWSVWLLSAALGPVSVVPAPHAHVVSITVAERRKR